MVTIFNIFLVMLNVSWIITTTYSSWSVRQLFTSFDREWARDGVLCLLLFNGRAAMVAFLSHRGQVSVGEGLRLPTAWSNVWNRNHIKFWFQVWKNWTDITHFNLSFLFFSNFSSKIEIIVKHSNILCDMKLIYELFLWFSKSKRHFYSVPWLTVS